MAAPEKKLRQFGVSGLVGWGRLRRQMPNLQGAGRGAGEGKLQVRLGQPEVALRFDGGRRPDLLRASASMSEHTGQHAVVAQRGSSLMNWRSGTTWLCCWRARSSAVR